MSMDTMSVASCEDPFGAHVDAQVRIATRAPVKTYATLRVNSQVQTFRGTVRKNPDSVASPV